MTDVLHHLPDVQRFFADAARCLRPGGVVVMHEPWVTPWSTLFYGFLHHEPFTPDAPSWELTRGGPLSQANGALPWIVFKRDRHVFEQTFPEFRVRCVRPGTPIFYLASGGVGTRELIPGWTVPLWLTAEAILSPWANTWAMFAQITLVREGTVDRGSIGSVSRTSECAHGGIVSQRNGSEEPAALDPNQNRTRHLVEGLGSS